MGTVVMKMMKAAVLKEFNKDLVIEDVPLPRPEPNEVLIKVRASGLCGSDLHIQEGKIATVKLPHILGHEIAGEIYSLGDQVTEFKKGDHVVVAIDVLCGKCRFCRTGRGNLCSNLRRIGFEINGGHAEYVSVPKQVLYNIGAEVPFEEAAIIPDAIACMYHAFKSQGNVRTGDRVCIMGIGGLGLQGVQIAKLFGAEVYCTSRQDEKLKIAKNFGADGIINTKVQSLYDEILKYTHGEMCDVVFDNIGIENSIMQGLSICRSGGKVIIVGYIDKSFCVEYQDIMRNEKEIIGMRGSTSQDLIEVIRLVEQGKIKPYIYKTYRLTEINEALTNLKEGKSLGRTVIMH
jgi:2-desacetyl-2-hydroxyethyl bacteriochlorophyllide A dehydrogenase